MEHINACARGVSTHLPEALLTRKARGGAPCMREHQLEAVDMKMCKRCQAMPHLRTW